MNFFKYNKFVFEILGKGASRVKEFREKREFKGQVEYGLRPFSK
jgi:hypothetical protein